MKVYVVVVTVKDSGVFTGVDSVAPSIKEAKLRIHALYQEGWGFRGSHPTLKANFVVAELKEVADE